MRRFRRIAAPVLGTIAAAGLLVLAGAGTSSAAEGVLYINRTAYEFPSGCYPISHNEGPAFVRNETSEPALVYLFPDCAGPVVRPVYPGQEAVIDVAQSLLIR